MSANNKHSLASRASYWFDNKMAEGLWPKVRLLLVVTALFVLIVGGLAAVIAASTQSEAPSPEEAFVKILMYALGKGGALTLKGEGFSILYFLLMLITILYCMFLSAILIGLINNALRSKVEELGKGQSNVLESGHTLILGFNEATFVLINELIESDRNQPKPQTLVILGTADRSVMVDKIHKQFGAAREHPKTRIICRTGSPYNFADLSRCSIQTSRVVIVSSDTDFETIKTIMACHHLLKDCGAEEGPYFVAVVHGEENIEEIRIIAQGKTGRSRLEMLSLNDVLARIMVHTSRQPGLSDVFTELFNFDLDEFYVFDDDPSFPNLYGKTIAEINHYLQMSYAVGVCKQRKTVAIGPPHEILFEEGDSLIVIKEDDDALQVAKKPGRKVELSPVPLPEEGSIHVLIVGVQPILKHVLNEYAEYLKEGSTIYVVDKASSFDAFVPTQTKNLLAKSGINVEVLVDILDSRDSVDSLLEKVSPDCALVLVDHDASDPTAEDERVIRMLIYMRAYRSRSDKRFSITSEMLLPQNKELAATVESDDFIISRHFASLLMAQVSQNRNLSSVFETLLTSEGFEIYMKPASWYVPLEEPVDLISAGESVANRGEVFIGIKQKIDGSYMVADINPSKYVSDMQTLRQYVFGPDDYFVVLAEDNGY